MRHGAAKRWLLRAMSSLLLGVAGCSGCGSDPGPVAPDRDADVKVALPGQQPDAKLVYLEQNWTPAESLQFYFTSQGSQILPYDWFLKLEQAADTTALRDDKNLLRFGYLLQNKDTLNPDALPVGFVKDVGSDRAWLGLTCAACHTSQLDYKGVGYRIDGGPSLADVRGFLVAVTESLKATRDQADKFERFAAKVSDPKDTLKATLSEIIRQREGYNVRNFPADMLPLHGRVDAFGAIMNEVFHAIAKPPPAPDDYKANTGIANAPVSYPCLWDTPQHDRVQWNGVAQNAGLGGLGRNVGEVLGVFGKVVVPDPPGMTGYQSTTKVKNLLAIEASLKRLWSPQWPSGFPKIDSTLREQGRLAYLKARCNECHTEPEKFDRTDPLRRVIAQMRAVGTDSLMATNFATRRPSTGKLEGAYLKVVGLSALGSEKFQAKASADDVLGHVVIGTILGSGYDAPPDELTAIEFKKQKPRIIGGQAAPIAPGGGGTYKARPLNGVWATAPYLHNGSVPTLYHLLLPAKDRPKSFPIGSREFDPEHVGLNILVNAPGGSVFVARNDDGKPVDGNSNEGHEFGTEAARGTETHLDENERRALLEYLKSL